jgi:hypothetical protein
MQLDCGYWLGDGIRLSGFLRVQLLKMPKEQLMDCLLLVRKSVGQDGNRMVRMGTQSPYVQRSSTATMRLARANLRWRREHARGKE